MKASMWGVVLIALGLIGIAVIVFFGQVSTSNDQNYYLLKEATEAAMTESVDLVAYRYGYIDDTGNEYAPGVIKIDEEKFVESLIRRYAESADITRQYQITIYDIIENPPKVVIGVKYGESVGIFKSFFKNSFSDEYEFNITNNIAAIIEEKTIK